LALKNQLTSKEFFEGLFEQLDITPSQFKEAEQHYKAVADHLSEDSLCDDVYVQGSFALGTVIRPFRKGKDADYDLDVVCQSSKASKETIKPKDLKYTVRDSILRSPPHARLLDPEEGRRCWTLNYAARNDVGFHMDILPCVAESRDTVQKIKVAGVVPVYSDTAIAITDRDKFTGSYEWSSSNPRGLASWFRDINAPYLSTYETKQREDFQQRYSQLYASVEDVPNALLKSPLQRVIQLLKRQRDCDFDGKENEKYKPISIIITVLVSQIAKNKAAHYASPAELYELIVNELKKYVGLLGNDYAHLSPRLQENYIFRGREGWRILNPVDPFENFAERWHEDDHARARAFFDWVASLNARLNLDGLDTSTSFETLQKRFGRNIVTEVYLQKDFNPTRQVVVQPSNVHPRPYHY